METEFREGDIIVINPYLKAEHNDYVVIANAEGDATFKQLKKYGNTKNRFYRVDPKLRGDKVEVRYDPFGDMLKVWIYSLHGAYLGQGASYHRDQGVNVHTPSSPAKIFFIDLDL